MHPYSVGARCCRLVFLSALIQCALFPISAFATVGFNDVANGNWEDGATWGNASPGVEGVDYPGPGQNPIIDSHIVTVTTNRTMDGVTVSGGTLNLGSNQITIVSGLTYASGTINADTSTVIFTEYSYISGSVTLHNVVFDPNAAYDTEMTIEIGTTLTVAGNLTIDSSDVGKLSIVDGTVIAQGDITIDGPDLLSATSSYNTTTLRIEGSGNQLFSVQNGTRTSGGLPNLNIAKSGGTLTLDGTIRTTRDWTYTSGTVDPGTSTVVFSTASAQIRNIIGSHTLNNVIFDTNSATASTFTIGAATTLTINGNLTIDNSSSGQMNLLTGTLSVKGDTSIDGLDIYTTLSGSTTTLLFSGTGNQAFSVTNSTRTTGGLMPVNINKPSGTLSLSGTIRTIRDWTYVAGTIDPGTSTVVFATYSSEARTITGTHRLNNIIFDTNSATTVNYTIAAGSVITAGGNLTIENSNTAAINILTGTVGVEGDIVVDGNDIYFAAASSSATIRPSGNANQTLTVNNCTRTVGGLLNLDVNKSGGSLTLVGTIRTFRNWTVTSGTVDPGTSTVVFATRTTEARTITGSHSLNNVIFDTNTSSSMAFTIAAGTTVTINGDLTVDNTSTGLMDFNTGTLAVKGQIYFDGANLQVASAVNTATLLINGTLDQTLTVANSTRTSGALVNINIDKASGTLFLVGTVRTARNWTYTNGTIDPGTSTVVFATRTSEARTITGTHTLGDVIFDSNSTSAMSYTIAAGNTLTVGGDLIIDNTSTGTMDLNTGTLAVVGDIYVDGANLRVTSAVNTTVLLVNGTVDQTLTVANSTRTSGALPVLNVDKVSGTLFLVGTIRTAKNWTVINGTIDAGTSTVVFSTYNTESRVITGSHALNNVIFDSNSTNLVSYTIAVGTTLTVNGTLTADNTNTAAMFFRTGTISAKGDVVVDGPNLAVSTTYNDTILSVDGTGNQNLTVQNATRTAGALPNVVINKASGTLYLIGTIRTARDWTYTSGTVDAGTSTVIFSTYNTENRVITGSHTLNNVIFDPNSSNTINYTIASGTTIAAKGNLTIDNTSTAAFQINTGALSVEGDLLIDGSNLGISSTANSATLTINGNGNQTFTDQNATQTTGNLPNIAISKSAGTLTLVGTIRTCRDWTYSSGAIDPGSSTVVFATYTGDARTITGTHTLNNIIFDSNSGSNNIYTLAGGAILTAAGNLTLANSGANTMSINGGGLVVQGNLTSNNKISTASTATLSLTGGNSQTVNAVNLPGGTITVNKTSGTVATLAANLVANTAGQDLTISSGTLDLAGFNLTVADVFSNDGTLRLLGNETVTFSGAGGFDEDSGTVDFRGTGVYAAGLPNGFGDQFYNLTFSGAGGAWTLDANTTVANDFTATAGLLDINDRTFAISGNTVIDGGTVLTGTNTVTFGNAGGDTITISAGELRIESDIPNTDIVTNAGTWTNSGGTISYSAGSPITQNMLTGQTAYYNLAVNSDASTYTLPDANVTVAGRLTLTDGTLAFDNDKNLIVSDTTATGTAISVVSGATLSNTGTGDLTIGGSVSNAGAITFDSSNDAGNSIVIASSDGATARNWAGTGTFSMTDVAVSHQSADIADPEFIYASSSTDSGDNTNWIFPPGTLTSPSVTLSNLGTGRSSTATIAFTLENVLPSDGKIVIVFPAGFNVSGVTGATSASDLNGSLAVSVVGQTVTITRSGGTAKAEGATIDDLVLTTLVNPSAAGATGTYDISTTSAADVTFDAGTAAASTLQLSVDYVWDGGGDQTSWSDPLNWTANSGYPDDAWDTATISSTAHTIVTPGVLTIGALTLGGTFSGTLQLGGVLNLDNSTIHDGDFTQSAGTLDVTAFAYQISIDGDWIRSGGIFNSRTGTVDFTRSSGTQLLNSGGVGGNNDFTNLTHSGAGTVQLTGSAIDLLGNFANSAGTFDANSLNISVVGTWNSTGGNFISGTNAVTFAGNAKSIVSGGVDDNHDFHNVIISLAASSYDLSVTTDVMDVDGDLTFAQGEFMSGTITLAGNLVVGAGVGNSAGLGTISFDGSGLQTIVNSSEATSRVADVTIGTTSQVRLDNLVAIGSLVVSSGGSLNANGNDILVSSNWTVDAGATFVSGGNTVSFVNSHTTIITGGVDDNHDFDDVVFNPIDSSRDYTVSTYAMDIDGDLTFTGGELVAGTINLAGNLLVGASLGSSGGLATIIFDGAALQLVSNSSGSISPIANFTISNSNEVRLEDAVVISGLVVSSAAVFNADSNNFSVRDTWMVDANGVFLSGANTVTFYGGNIAIMTGGSDDNHDFNNVVMALTNSSRDWIILTNDMSIAGDLTLTSGQTSIFTNIYLAGDLSVTTTNVGVMLGAGPLVFSGSVAQTVSNSAGETEALARIVVANTADVVQLLNAITVETLTIDNGAILDLNGNNITATGVFSNNGTLRLQGGEAPTFSGAGGFDEDSGAVEFTGTGTYAAGLPNVFGDRFYNLRFDGAGGSWVLDANLQVDANLSVSDGTLDVNDYSLTINGNTTFNGGQLWTGTNTITFGDAGGDSVTFTAGTLKVESDVLGSDIVKNAGSWSNTGGTILFASGSAITQTLPSYWPTYFNLTVDSSGSSYTLADTAVTVNGVLALSDGTLAFDNDKNLVINDNATTGTALAVAAGGVLVNTGTGDLTLGADVSNAGAITFNSSDDAANGIAITAVAMRSWSGTGSFSMSDVTVDHQSVDITDPEYILTSSSTDGGNNTGWVFPTGTLSAVSVTPASLVTSANGDVSVAFTTENILSSDGKIVVVFPAGFDVSGVSAASSASDIDGSLAVAAAGQTVTVTRSGGNALAEGTVVDDLLLAGITNPAYDGATATFSVSTTDASNVIFDTASAAAVTITGGTDYVWTGSGDGVTWASAANWDVGVGYPNSNLDSATINSTANAITTASAVTVGAYTQGATFSGSVTLGGVFTVDDAGGKSGDFTVAAGTFDTSNGSNYAVSVDRDFTLTAGAFQARGSTITVRRNVSIADVNGLFVRGTSTIVLAGSGTLSSPHFSGLRNVIQQNGITTTLAGTVYFNTGGNFTSGDASSTIQDNGVNQNFYFNAGTIVNNGATWNATAPGRLRLSLRNSTFGGGDYGNIDFRIETGASSDTTLTGHVVTTGDCQLAWDSTPNTTAVLATNNFNFSVGDMTVGSTTGHWNGHVIAGSSTITIAGDLTIRDASTGRQNMFDAGSGQIYIGGSFTVESVDTVDGIFAAGTSTVTFDAASGTPTITSAGNAFNDVVFNDGGNNITFTLEDSFNVDGDLTITSAALDSKNGENNSINIGGDFVNDDTFVSRSNTVTLDGTAAQSIDAGGTGISNDDNATDFHNLTISNTSAPVTLLSELEVDGNLTIDTNAVLDADGQTFDLNGALVNNGTVILQGGESIEIAAMDSDSGAVIYDGIASVTLPAIANYFNLTFDESGAADPTYTLPDVNVTVNGVLNVADGVLAFDNDKNIAVNDNGASGSAIVVAAAGSITNNGTGDLTIGGDVANAGSITFNSSDDASNAIVVASNDGATDRTWSGVGAFSFVDVAVSYQIAANPDPEFILASSSTDSGNNTNWVFPLGDLSSASITPASYVTNATGNVTVAFTNEYLIPTDGKIVVVFPSGFDVSAVSGATSAADIDGSLAVGVSGQTVTITRSGGTLVAEATAIDDLVIAGVKNPIYDGTTGNFTISTTDASNTTFDTITVGGTTITGGTDYVWTGAGDGITWASAANWDVGVGYPNNNEDTATINATASAITTSGMITVGAYTQGGTFSGSVTLGGAFTVDDAGGESGDFNVSAGTFDTNSSGNYAVNVDRDFSISGGVFQARNSTLTVNRNFSIANISGLFFRGNSTVVLAGDGTISVPHHSNGLRNLVQQNGITTTIVGTVWIQNNASFATGDATSTIQDNGSNALLFFNYSDLVNSGATWVSSAPGRLAVGFSGGTIGGGDYGNIKFQLSISSLPGTTMAGSVATTGDFVLVDNGTTPNTTATLNTNNFNLTVANLTIGYTTGNMNGHVKAGSSNVTITGDLRIRDASVGRQNIFEVSSAQVAIGGSLVVESVEAVPGTLITGTSTFTFAGTGATPTVTSAGNSFYNVIFNDAGNNITFTLEDTFDVNNNLTITGGTLDTKVGENNAISIGGNFVNDDTFISRSNTVTFNGNAAQSIDVGGTGIGNDDAGTDFNNVTIANTAAAVSLLSELEVDGTLAINANAVLDVDGHAFDLNGTLFNNGTLVFRGSESRQIGIMDVDSGTVRYDGTTSLTLPSDITTYFNVAFDESGTSDPTYTLPDSDFNVNGVLEVADAALVYDDDKNVTVSDNGGTGTAITIAVGSSFTNTGTGNLMLGGNVANSGTITFDASDNAGNGISIASTGAARDWGGSGTFNMTDVTVADQSVDSSDPKYIIATSATDDGGNSNWIFAGGTLTNAAITLPVLDGAAMNNATVEFTTQNLIPDDGKIVVTFPAGFDLTGVTTATSAGDIDGAIGVTVVGQSVVMTRSGGTAIATAAVIDDLVIADVVNPAVAGATGTFTFSTRASDDAIIDTAIVAGVVIAATHFDVSVSITFGGDPLAGVTLTSTQLGNATTNGSGEHDYVTIASGLSYVITPSKTGYVFSPSSISVVSLAANRTHVFTATALHSISGSVHEGSTPLANVAIDGGVLGSTTTNSSGVFSFSSVVDATSYTITPSKAGYSFSPGAASGTLNGADAMHSFTAIADDVAGISISGRVVAANAEGSPIPGVTVSNGTQSDVTDEQGYFTLSNVEEGDYVLTAVKDNFKFDLVSGAESLSVRSVDIDNLVFEARRAPGKNIYAMWNGFFNSSNIAEIVNYSTSKPLVVQLQILSNIESASQVKAQSSYITIPAGRQQDVVINNLDGFSQDSYGIVKLTASHADFDGRISVYRPKPFSSEQEFGYAVAFTSPSAGAKAFPFNTFYPGVASSSVKEVHQWLAIANTNSSRAANFTIEKRSFTGELLSEEAITVPPLERRDIEAGHIFPGLDQVGLIRVVPFDSSQRYFAQLNRYAFDSSTKVFDFAVVLAPSTDGETKLRTVIANPGNTYTFVEIANQYSTAETVQIKLRNDEGDVIFTDQQLLAPYAQFHLRADHLLDLESNGVIELSHNTPGAIVAYALSYVRDKDSENIFAAYESPLRDSYGTIMYGSFNMFLNMLNSIRIGNISDNQTIVRLHFGSGGNLGASSVITIEPHATKIIDIGRESEFSSFESNKNSYGLISVETTSKGAVIPEVIRLGVEQERYQFGVSTQIR